MVQDAPMFQIALGQFFDWCHNIKDDFRIFRWSESDYEQIVKEAELKEVCLNSTGWEIMQKFEDLQKEYGDTLGVTKKVSLKDAVMYAGLDFSGHKHDALDDAKNTAALLRIIRVTKLCKEVLENVIDAFCTKPVRTSLGDLLHLEELAIIA